MGFLDIGEIYGIVNPNEGIFRILLVNKQKLLREGRTQPRPIELRRMRLNDLIELADYLRVFSPPHPFPDELTRNNLIRLIMREMYDLNLVFDRNPLI